MVRAGPLTLLLVIVLTVGAAAQSPSPSSAPPAMADDLALAIPPRVGDIAIDIDESMNVERLIESWGRDLWTEWLRPHGKVPEDVEFVTGTGYTPPAPDPSDVGFLAISVYRVAGVSALDLIAAKWGVESEALEWQVFGERRVAEVDAYGSARVYVYPMGDIWFEVGIVPDDHSTPTIEDVLAALP